VHFDFDDAVALTGSQRPPLTLKETAARIAADFRLVCRANKSRISVNTPVYVAGFERGVRPMGDWSMAMTLSSASMRGCRHAFRA
jgi:hypothetical protein